MSGATASAFLPRSAFQHDLLYTLGGGDPRVTIAVLDGPVDRTHECFRGARLTPITEVVASPASDDRAIAQGSHTASVIFGQPCSSVEGQAPLCRGLIVPIFTDGAMCSPQQLAQAIVLAVEHGAQIIHVSGGAFAAAAEGDAQLAKALALCRRRNVLIIAAAGRRGSHELLRAAASAPVLAVEAIEQLAPPTRYQHARSVHGIALPGNRILGAALEGREARRSGATSAAALASAIAGLLLSRQLATKGSCDPSSLRQIMCDDGAPAMARTGSARLQSLRDIERLAERAGLPYPAPQMFG